MRRICLSICAALAPTATAAEQPARFTAMVSLSGDCHELVLGDRDLSKNCRDGVINTVYRDGRSSFQFLAGDYASVSFYGLDSSAKGDRALLKVEKVTVTLLGTKIPPNVLRASGSCQYTNPYAGPSLVECSATTDKGPFRARFISNGEPPE